MCVADAKLKGMVLLCQLGRLAAAVWEKTAGLPLYVDQMVAHLHAQV